MSQPRGIWVGITDVRATREWGGAYKTQQYKVESTGIVGQEATATWCRFSGLFALRSLLCALFPGLFVPPLPPKKFLQMPSLASWTYDEFLRERRDDIQRFLVRCAAIPAIRESHAFQVFLRDDGIDFKSAAGSNSLEHCEVNHMASVIERLEQNFTHSVGRVPLPGAEGDASQIDRAVAQLADVFRNSYEALQAARTALEGVYSRSAALVAGLKDLVQYTDDLRSSEAEFSQRLFAGASEPAPAQRIAITPQLASLREWTAYGMAFLKPLSTALRLESLDCEVYLQLLAAVDSSQAECDKLRRKIGQLMQKPPSPKTTQQLDQVRQEYEQTVTILRWRQRFLLSDEERLSNWRSRITRYGNCVAKVVQAQLTAAREQSAIRWSVAFGGEEPEVPEAAWAPVLGEEHKSSPQDEDLPVYGATLGVGASDSDQEFNI